ncbi:MAG: hypothetical protein ACJAYV_000454 [Oleispira sp.]|jgi:hypothetical protein
MSLDKNTLDSMLLGRGRDSDWVDLIKSSNRETLWQQAVNRRESMDLYVEFVSRSPKLALLVRNIKTSFRAGKAHINEVVLDISDSMFPLSTQLDSNDQVDIKASINISWGKDALVEVRHGSTVDFQLNTAVSVYYQYLDSNGWLTSENSWKVENSDGPVVLIFFDQIIDDITLDEALLTSENKAVVTLLPVN